MHLSLPDLQPKVLKMATGFWQALQSEKPELIVLDVMLPGKDGVTLLKLMKANEAFADIPVIMATAKGSEYDKIQSLDLGADDYLVKPFGIMEMVSRVKAVLDIVDRTLAAYGSFDREQAVRIEPQEQVVDAMVREVKSRHVRRLRDALYCRVWLRAGRSVDRLRAYRRPLLQCGSGNAAGCGRQAGSTRISQCPEGW